MLASQVAMVSAVTPAEAFSPRTLVIGSSGYDVDELQNRLSYLGYFHHKTTGVFSWDTYWGVRDFQQAFGLKVNGRVDMRTKLALVKATRGWQFNGSGSTNSGSGSSGSGSPVGNAGSRHSTPSGSNGGGTPSHYAPSGPVGGISASDQNLLAHVVNAEARGEPFVGQVAVAAVILNRLQDPIFPHTIPGIIYQPLAFTSVQDGQINLPPDTSALKAVHLAVNGYDPSDGATYYFNPATSTSKWIWSKPEILQIGHHIFCRS